MSPVAKGNDDFRLIVNVRGLNKAINREYCRLPLLEEMKVKPHVARYFPKLALSNAYYHLELCEEPRDLIKLRNGNVSFHTVNVWRQICARDIPMRNSSYSGRRG